MRRVAIDYEGNTRHAVRQATSVEFRRKTTCRPGMDSLAARQLMRAGAVRDRSFPITALMRSQGLGALSA